MLDFFSSLIDANKREINKLSKIVNEINALEGKIKRLDDKKFKAESLELRRRREKGEGLDLLLPEAFAFAREAASRTLGMRHFDVQLIAAIALHNGKIAEQRTGEGKTMSAVPTVFLNALSGKGVHVVTVNDYLARRDAGWNGPIYHMLGVSVAVIIHEKAFIYDPKYKDPNTTDKRLKNLKPISRKEAYEADITYGTNNEFGFDYLRDNMANALDNQSQRGHHFAIVDEVDSILIDEARTPLIISAPDTEPTGKYIEFSKIVDGLNGDTDFVVNEKERAAHLTEHGILKIEKSLGVPNLYEKDFSTLHHIEEALKAKTLFLKDRDYVVKEGEVIIVDEFTGRLMPGRRYSGGLHQAIEAKEDVTIQQESKTLATISFQNYFRMYEKLSGMTGTAATEAEEFFKIYKLEVVIVPTHQPMIRKDHSDAIFKTQTGKYNAVAAEIEKIHATGQPILIGTTSIEKNEFLSELLKRKRISHALLNAKNHEREAEIIADAGAKGAVTVATNLAGRGVDIKLGKGVDKLGGLYVIGTERHESRRIDNQLRGRSGRQGDPGASKFFVSLEDDFMRIFGGDQVAKVMGFLKMPEDVAIENPLVSKAIEGAQKKVEGHNFDIRKHTVEYDDVMNQQRQIIYGVRKQILEIIAGTSEDGKTLKKEIQEKIAVETEAIVDDFSEGEIDYQKIVEDFATIITFDEASVKGLLKEISDLKDPEQIKDFLVKIADDLYDQKEKTVGADIMRQMESFVYLNTIDNFWMEHLDTMDDLRSGIGLRGYAQRDPLIEYKKEGFELFEKMITEIDSEVARRIYKVSLHTHTPVQTPPVDPDLIGVDLSRVVEGHEEALDETALLEEVGQLMPNAELSAISHQPSAGETKVKVEGSSDDEKYSSPVTIEEPIAAGTRVTVERGGQVVSQDIYNETGSLQRKKPGRNEPCYCGSGKKYKRCHYPN
ncbi:preprotein translocase subunit SecA [Candidatus Daviesbacteria bacterium]|nr:preprotein translocase subunit SecA [Candidatus Daviesbacteria bacterium]